MPKRSMWNEPREEQPGYHQSTPCPIPKHLALRFHRASCVPLIVGPQEVRFEVHRDRLFSASSWFKCALESGMKETSSQQITLPADEPAVVDILVQWMYTADPTFPISVEDTFLLLVQVYELANRLFIRELKNYVIWKLFVLRGLYLVLSMPAVSYAFKKLPETDTLQKIFTAWFTWHHESALTLNTDVLNDNPQFSAELVLSLLRRQNGIRDILTKSPSDLYEAKDLSNEAPDNMPDQTSNNMEL